jgi:uncharacterized tellurite resistance protein B-like protein
LGDSQALFDQIKSLLGLKENQHLPDQIALDKNLAAAVLMVHVIAADGKIAPEEEERLDAILRQHYAVTDAEAKTLAQAAKLAQSDAIDMYSFTSILKTEMEESERRALVEDLWEMVYADGEVHEFEDNVVWRVAELIGIQSRERMILKQRVLARRNQDAGTPV